MGSAVAFALADAGVESLAIRDVDEQRARVLAAHVNSAFGEEIASGGGVGEDSPVEALIARSDGVFNATPLGMPSHPGMSFDPTCLSEGQWVSDVVHMPVDTELLSCARSTGCQTLDGTHLAVNQAVDAFTIFTGLTADAARMREVFEAQG